MQVAPTGVGDLYARCPVLNHLIKVPPRAQYVQDAERLGGILRELAAGAMHPIYFAPCVQMLPLRTPVLVAWAGGPNRSA